MDKTQESVAQLFVLIRSQGALLSALVKTLIKRELINQAELKTYETEITRRLDVISKLASQNQDVREQLESLEAYITNKEPDVA